MLYLKYTLFAIISVVGDFLAAILAPLAALFCYRGSDGREHLYSFWKWITTHDTPVDTYTEARGFSKDNHWYLGRYSYEEINSSKWLRYVSRIVWIWRNPAYQLDHWLGYDQEGVVLTKYAESEDTWDVGVPSYAYWTAVNHKGQKAFLWERQIYFYKKHCLEMQFGWKLYRDDPDSRCMLALRITPFKSYG